MLCAVAERDAYANLLLPATLTERGLTGRDAALATELTYGTLRGQGTYDAVLAVCSDRALDSLDPAVRQILRLGSHQLLATRIASHAAVATSVDLVRDVVGPRPAGFVNAVLRRVAARDIEAWLEIAAPAAPTTPRATWPSGTATPGGSCRARCGEALGGSLAETEAALAADSERPAVTLCAVPGLAGPAELDAAGAAPARWSPFGAYLSEGDPAGDPGRRRGPGRRPGRGQPARRHRADPRARPATTGGSTCAPGPAARPGCSAAWPRRKAPGWSPPRSRPHRARLVRSAAVGAPGRATGVVVADGTRPPWAARHLRPGHRRRPVLRARCPAPPSRGSLAALPAGRRRPGRLAAPPADLGPGSARPGGVVAYVTCSPHLAETRDVVADVLAARGGVEVLDAPAVLSEVPGLACADPDGRYAQFWPHRHGTDAIFVALLRVPRPRARVPVAAVALN